MELNLFKAIYSIRLYKINKYYLGAIMLAIPGLLLAQLPSISYPSSLKFKVGNTISKITPLNSGGAVPNIGYGQVSTYSGNFSQGVTDGLGTTASFFEPTGITTDAAGNIYIADYSNNLIRKIDPSGQVSTIAGTGASGFADGKGTSASFNYPTGLAVDLSGNIYIADSGNNRIRKIDNLGTVTTIAGNASSGSLNGIGIAASFSEPAGLAIDANNNIYVTDAGNNLIRKIDALGVVTTIAGSGKQGADNGIGVVASFWYPRGIATDSEGNIYVADSNNNLIRKINSNGIVSTFAGTGTYGKSDGTGTLASFSYPTGVAIDKSGNIYVVDQSNNVIRKISSTAQVTTYAGSGVSGANNGNSTVASFNYIKGVAIDNVGNVGSMTDSMGS